MTDYAIAGLDIASTTGLAFRRGDEIKAETFRLKSTKNILDNAKGLNAAKMGVSFREFEDFIISWLLDNKVSHCAIEEPLNTNFSQRRVKRAVAPEAAWAGKASVEVVEPGVTMETFFKIHGLEAMACAACMRLNIHVEFVNQATWRKTFLDNGRPKEPKRAAKKRCETLGIKVTSLDAAEAVGVMWWMDQKVNPYGARSANDLFSKS